MVWVKRVFCNIFYAMFIVMFLHNSVGLLANATDKHN